MEENENEENYACLAMKRGIQSEWINPFILIAISAASNKIKDNYDKLELVSSLVILIVVCDCSEKLND